jgi:hypothetical protein
MRSVTAIRGLRERCRASAWRSVIDYRGDRNHRDPGSNAVARVARPNRSARRCLHGNLLQLQLC